jgi:KDO2-lipid IV(A) lauroyltransferase
MYYLIYGLLYVISLLPLRVLYLLSDFFYVIIFYIAGYRKKVVMGNLEIAFPDKSQEERHRIAKKFYHNLTDSFIEMIKLVSAGKKFANRHFKADYSVFETLYAQGKKCQVHLGHNFNWEIGNLAIATQIPQKYLVVYMPFGNKAIEKIFYKMRTKTGAILLPATEMRTAILPWRGENYALILVADQSPPFPKNGIWTNFFGRPTPFVRGPENGARIADIPVVFCHFTKKKRGYYEGHFTLACEHPGQLEKGALTKIYARFLEEKMAEQPDIWLWSHKRWKWSYKEEFGTIY